MATHKRFTEVDRAFHQGFAIAVAILVRTHDRPTMALDIMWGCGITLEDLKRAKVDPYDLKPLRKAVREA